MIPKIIHYCWFGNNEKNDLIKKCIKSWKKYCPDYEIIEWNETNFDVNFCQYTKQAYETGKYAFVSDVARLYIIYKYGGIYLDTDVEVIGKLDNLLKYSLWFNWETERFINTGLGFGGEKGNKIVKSLLEDYIDKKFLKNDNSMDLTACPKLNTLRLLELEPGLRRNGSTQIFENRIYLHPDIHTKIAIHHYAGSWVNNNEYLVKKAYKYSYIKSKLRNEKIFNLLEKYFSSKIVDVYTILVYDVMDNGIIYFFKRCLKKIRYK